MFNFRDVYNSGEVHRIGTSWRGIQFSDSLKPADIEPWMTFAYINTVFKLPETYLQQTLGIADIRYPNTSIQRLIRKNNLNGIEFMTRLRQAVSVVAK